MGFPYWGKGGHPPHIGGGAHVIRILLHFSPPSILCFSAFPELSLFSRDMFSETQTQAYVLLPTVNLGPPQTSIIVIASSSPAVLPPVPIATLYSASNDKRSSTCGRHLTILVFIPLNHATLRTCRHNTVDPVAEPWESTI